MKIEGIILRKFGHFFKFSRSNCFLIAYTSSLCYIEAPHIVRNWPNFSWIQFDILDMVTRIDAEFYQCLENNLCFVGFPSHTNASAKVEECGFEIDCT